MTVWPEGFAGGLPAPTVAAEAWEWRDESTRSRLAARDYSEKLDALHQAGDAACADDDRFTLDRLDLAHGDMARMKTVCQACPLFTLCKDYARSAKPPGGFWAGAYWGRKDPTEDQQHPTERTTA